MKEKVAGYLIRRSHAGFELLVFDHSDHPEAGRQVPGGTTEAGEKPAEAILREFSEESGLTNLSIVRSLGVIEFLHQLKNEWQRKTVFLLHSPEHLPDRWQHTVSGIGEDENLRFEFYWVPIQDAGLIYDQGDFLKHIRLEEEIPALKTDQSNR